MIPEIQGLRALAVALVVVFHLWPGLLPGGYVGVDVFFVISGYLITGALWREAERTGGIDLPAFYARRIRRLLPAASLTLIVTGVAAPFLLPPSWIDRMSSEIGAAALYMENWLLSAMAVDYLDADSPPGPIQHFWSLSIEEQFYLLWPVLLLLAVAVSRRAGRPSRLLALLALGLVFTASLLLSIGLTAQAPAQAYFATHTRIWELALGGLLALSAVRGTGPSRLRAAGAPIGLMLILVAALGYDEATPFPGYLALAPTLGCALIIWAGDIRLRGMAVLGNRAMGFIGDRSYSIYLWHWPIVVFAGFQLETIGPVSGMLLTAVILALSHASYHLVEDPFRRACRPPGRTLQYGALSIGACLTAALGLQMTILLATDTAPGDDPRRYPGPSALMAGARPPETAPPMPDIAVVRDDLPTVYAAGCHQKPEGREATWCSFGDPTSRHVVAVAGDSHAAAWIPALSQLAAREGWRLLTFTKSACPFSRIDVLWNKRPYTACVEWRENVLDALETMHVDLLITTQSRYPDLPDERVTAGLLSMWQDVAARGIDIVAIGDTPWMPFHADECLARHAADECVAPRAEAMVEQDPIAMAARRFPAQLIDMTDYLCRPADCPAVIGNIVVWRDNHHLTATYSRRLAPYLKHQLGPLPF